MPEQLQKIVQPIVTKWDTLTRDQRIKLISAISVVLVALFLAVFLTVRTQYELFTSGLDAARLMPIESALTDEGIKHKRTNNSTALLVDKKRMGDAKVAVDSSPEVQGTKFTFADALDRNTMGTTETTRRAMLLNAKQTEIADALTTFEGVNSARVLLHVPERITAFLPGDDKATASVTLNVSREMTREEGMSMARFVTRSVEGLEIEGVEILDNQLRTVFSGLNELENRGRNIGVDLQDREIQQIRQWISSIFIPLSDEVRVVPNLVYDSQVSRTDFERVYSPPTGSEDGFVATEVSSNEQAKNQPIQNEPGTGSQDQTPPSYELGAASESSASRRQQELTRIFNIAETTQEHGPASYNRGLSTLTVSLYQHRHYYQQRYVEDDRNFSQGDWENLISETPRFTVIEDPNMDLYKQSIASATGIPLAGITFIVNEVPVFHPYTRSPFDWQFVIMMIVLALLILMLAFGLIRRAKIEEEEELEPELSVEDLLVSTQLEEAKEEEVAQLEEIDYFKESEVKKQIEKFVNEKPEAVAALLRNWLNAEEW